MGSFGGFSTGVALLKKGQMMFVAVGQKGDTNAASFNGGGIDLPLNSCNTQTGAGSRCTHFTFKTGELKSLSKNQSSVFLFASGGVSNTRMCSLNTDSGSFDGGHGGGTIGASPIYKKRVGYTEVFPTGGTQISGGVTVLMWNQNSVDLMTEVYT